MNVRLPYGRHQLDLELAAERCLGVFRGPPPLPDPAHAIRQALEVPWRYPPLRRALTPDDHVVIVVDETLPHLGALLPVVLEHVAIAGVSPAAITLLCPPGDAAHPWIDDLPDEFGDVHVEDHDPKNRQHLAYLATTRGGRRVYLNRTLIDADQVVVFGSRRYDLLLGYAGAEGALFPAFSDEPTHDELDHRFHAEVPGARPWPLRERAVEVAWLLGQPFYVQGIASAGAGLAHVVAGGGDSTQEGQRLLDVSWRHCLTGRPETVVVTLSGDAARTGFVELAGAIGAAARVVRPGGRVVIVSEAMGGLPPGFEVMLRGDDLATAVAALEKTPRAGYAAALQWARGVSDARVSVLSRLTPDLVEDLFATPLDDVAQVQRLVADGGSCVFLEDGQRMMLAVG